MKRRFTELEKKFVSDNLEKLNVRDIARKLRRTKRSIYNYIHISNLKKKTIRVKGIKHNRKINPWDNPTIAMCKVSLTFKSNLLPSDIPDILAEIQALKIKLKRQLNGSQLLHK